MVSSTGLGQQHPEHWVLLPWLFPGCSRLSLPIGRRNPEPQGCSPKGQRGRLPKRRGEQLPLPQTKQGRTLGVRPPAHRSCCPSVPRPPYKLLAVTPDGFLPSVGLENGGWLITRRAPPSFKWVPLFGVQLLNQPTRCGAAPAHPSRARGVFGDRG